MVAIIFGALLTIKDLLLRGHVSFIHTSCFELFLTTVETEVRSLMAYWYQPKITREEAIGLVQQMNSGAFIVRDSQTVSGGYALTIKVMSMKCFCCILLYSTFTFLAVI